MIGYWKDMSERERGLHEYIVGTDVVGTVEFNDYCDPPWRGAALGVPVPMGFNNLGNCKLAVMANYMAAEQMGEVDPEAACPVHLTVADVGDLARLLGADMDDYKSPPPDFHVLLAKLLLALKLKGALGELKKGYLAKTIREHPLMAEEAP